MRPIRHENNIDAIENFISEARTYLMSLKGYSDLLALGTTGQATPEQQEMIQQIQQSVQQLQELCSKVLVEVHEERDQRTSALEENGEEK